MVDDVLIIKPSVRKLLAAKSPKQLILDEGFAIDQNNRGLVILFNNSGRLHSRNQLLRAKAREMVRLHADPLLAKRHELGCVSGGVSLKGVAYSFIGLVPREETNRIEIDMLKMSS